MSSSLSRKRALTKILATGALSTALVLSAAACSDSDETTTTTTTSAADAAHDHDASSDVAHNDADIAFAQGMLPHHEQAIVMSDIMLEKSDIPANVTAMAKQIKDAQGPEITTLTGWLKEWNAPTDAPMDHEMDGMMSEDDLNKLRAATGTEAAKLFLTQMIEHHEGAVDMAEDEIEDGKNADAVAMAKSIVESQQKEIDEMRTMLKGL